MAASAALVLLGAPRLGGAQPRTLTACTPDALEVCAELRLTSGPGLFEVGVRALGARGRSTLPTSIYNLVLGTGAAAVSPGSERATLVTPAAVGGATVVDESAWDLFETGDLIFLSALSNNGVGGCLPGAPVGGFGQAGRTCGAGEYLTFQFASTRLFNPNRFTILNLEAVGLEDGLPGASCGAADQRCEIERDTYTPGPTVPEPATWVLFGTGLAILIGETGGRRRWVRGD